MVTRTLSVIGLGYIGLPTAVVLATHGWRVIGVDVSDRTVDYVSRGELPFIEEGLDAALKKVISNGSLTAQMNTPKSNVYIVAVPTPFTGDHEADLSYIDAAVDAIAPQLEGGELIILESTSPPGATEHMAKRIIDARPELSLDGKGGARVIHCAHAPERVLPGRIMTELVTNDRIIGGLTHEATEQAKAVYGTFCTGTIHTTDALTAEMTKLTENSFRDVNIAFANELSLICDKLGIDVWKLIELANKHPRVNILQPGPGVGGHCIAVDPWFIVSADRENSRLIRTAREVNDAKPQWVIDEVEKQIRAYRGTGLRVGILGLAFKADIDDLRESPAIEIARSLIERNPSVQFDLVEPCVDSCPEMLASFSNATWSHYEEALSRCYVLVLLVDHKPFLDIGAHLTDDQCLIDTRGVTQKS